MKYLLIVILSIGLGACASRPPKPLNERMMLDLHTNIYHVIPDECYDDQGQFDENIGDDDLDCGNL